MTDFGLKMTDFGLKTPILEVLQDFMLWTLLWTNIIMAKKWPFCPRLVDYSSGPLIFQMESKFGSVVGGCNLEVVLTCGALLMLLFRIFFNKWVYFL